MDNVAENYGLHKILKDISYDSALQKVKNVLAEHDFSLLYEIDVKKNIQNKLNLYFNKYTICGICNPELTYKSLKIDEDIGLLLPCNIAIYERKDGIMVSIINPEEIGQIIENNEIQPIMQEIKSKLMQIIDDL